MKTYYFYHSDTKEFYRTVEAEFPETPENAVQIRPEIITDYRPVWNGKAWVQTEDHRKKTIYKDNDSQTVTWLGPIPEGWSFDPPPAPDPSLEEKLNWDILKIKNKLYNLDVEYLTPRTLAGLSIGDSYAQNRLASHEAEAAPLRAQLAALKDKLETLNASD
jgi:hypothetical protein